MPPGSQAHLWTCILACVLTACGESSEQSVAPSKAGSAAPIAEGQARVDPDAELAAALEDLGLTVTRGMVEHPSIVLVDSYTGDDHYRTGAGVFVDPATIAVPYRVIEEADRVEIELGNCEHAVAAGVVGVDGSLRVALIALEAAPSGVAPLTQGPMPEPGDALGHHGVLTIIRPDCGFASASCDDCVSCLGTPSMTGWGPTIVVDVAADILARRSPILDAEGQWVGLLLGPAGGGSSFVLPALAIDAIERTEPVPLDVFARRERSAPERAALHLHRAVVLRVEGDIRAAVVELEQALQDEPDDWNALHELGVCRDLLGDPSGALKLLTRSIEIEPDYAESHYSVGIIRLKAGEPASALPPLQEAARLDPEYANAQAMLAVALVQTGRLEDGLEAGERALSLTGVEPGHYANLVSLCMQQERFSDAERIARRWTEDDPSESWAWHALGHALCMGERFDDAIEPLEKALDLGDDRAETFYFLVVSLGQTGRESRAKELVERGLARYPDDSFLLGVKRMLERPDAP